MVHRVNTREREIGIDRPDSLPNLANKILRATQGTADYESYIAISADRPALEFCHQCGAIDVSASRFVHPVVVHISHDADNFAPIIDGRDSNPLAQRSEGVRQYSRAKFSEINV